MKNNQLFMFNIKKVYNFFKDLMKYDIYNRCDMEWFLCNSFKDIGLEELYIMEKTVIEDMNNNSRTNSLFWSSISVIIALFIGTVTLAVSLDLKIKHDYILIGIFLFIQLVIMYALIREHFVNRKRNRLYDLIRILIHLKENEQTI